MTIETTEFESMDEAISQATINRYADLSGDYNPLHVDVAFAEASEFGGTIAHGPMQLQPFFRSMSAFVGADTFPPGSKVSVTYRHPARPGDTVHFEATRVVEDENVDKVITIEGHALNQDGVVLAQIDTAIPMMKR